ncbi:MAG TPA: PilZ domain-containing protein [Chloroflexota bacterium]|nr:PilZ domain-containing protein [Chloroflexota bacterium]
MGRYSDGTFCGGAALETSMSADAWLSMPSETPNSASSATMDASAPGFDPPRPLEDGERIELWLAAGDPDAAGDPAPDPTVAMPQEADAGDPDAPDFEGWDVRPAQVEAAAGPFVAVATGGWGMTGEPGAPSAAGARAILRRLGADGIAEWEGTIATGAENVGGTRRAGAAETILVVRIDPGAGRLYQRRRSPRLAVRLSPVRLLPASVAPPDEGSADGVEDGDLTPVARLSDVSAHGAAIVVDTPLETGTTVTLEFELPGEPAPFQVRGRVVEPAVALHGDVQPQPDGLPGFRRGIEFLGHAASRESRRLAAVLTRLLQSDATRQ